MTVFVLIACATAWSNYYDADNCRVVDVYRDYMSAKIRASQVCDGDLPCHLRTRVLPFKVRP